MNKKWASAAAASPQTIGGSSGGGFSSTPSVLSFIGEPPDLSQISDPAVVVLFKNLSKREEVTKAKALEGLLAAVAAAKTTEDAVLNAWVRLYPRLSIDVSARIRRLANSLQGEIGAKSGKRLARHMSKLVGPWLCGLFDSDRASARAVKESLLKVFKSEAKLGAIWKTLEAEILAFCRTTVVSETVQTLSDERWVGPDDAEAKFARVMATCCLAVAHLISTQDLELLETSYAQFLGEKTLWAFAFHADSFLRRVVYKLLLEALGKRPQWIAANLEMVATALVVKASAKPQPGSASAYLEALTALTRQLPEAWTAAKPARKRTPLAQLVSFVGQGSQLAPPAYWTQVSGLLAVLPKDALAAKDETAKNTIGGILAGIKAEPKSHLMAAWNCYWDVCYLFLELQPSQSDSGDNSIIRQSLLPVYEGYLWGSSPNEQHIISKDDTVASAICASGLVKLDRLSKDCASKVLSGLWKKMEDAVVDAVKAERRDAAANEASVRRCGRAWAKLVVGVLELRPPKDGFVRGALVESSVAILAELIESLLATNGKAVGAAMLLHWLLAAVGTEVLQDSPSLEITQAFFHHQFPSMLEGETIEHLFEAFISYGAHSGNPAEFQEAWKIVIPALLTSSTLPEEKKENSVILLLKSAAAAGSGALADKAPPPVPELDGYIEGKLRKALPEAEINNAWLLVKDALNTPSSVVSRDTPSKMLAELVGALDVGASPKTPTLSKVLDAISGADPHRILLLFVGSNRGKELVSKLLILESSSDQEIRSSAAGLRDIIQNAASNASDGSIERLADANVDNICASVQEPTSRQLSVAYLATKASDLVKGAPRESLADKLLFSEAQWEAAISPFLREVKNLSLAISNPLGGCIFLAKNGPGDTDTSWDSEGYSKVLRMAMFSIKLLGSLEDASSVVSYETLVTFLHHVLLVQEIAKDNLSVAGANSLWKEHSPEAESEISEFISGTSQSVLSTLGGDTGRQKSAPTLVDRLLERCRGQSAAAFYTARALSTTMSDLCEKDQFFRDRAVAWADEARVWEDGDVFQSVAMLVGSSDVLAHSKKERIWTGLIGALLAVSPAEAGTRGLELLVLLNAALPRADERPASLPQQRVVNLVRLLLSWLDEENKEVEVSVGLVVEVSKTLCHTLPIVGDVTDRWGTVLDIVQSCWEGCARLDDNDLPIIFSTLKLFQVVRSLLGGGRALDDVWAEVSQALYTRLLTLLSNAGRPDGSHQPRGIVNTQIAWQLRDFNVALVADPGPVYPLLGTQSRPIQKAAFGILHQWIPSQQEQISVDVALSGDAASSLRLPPEILSLVIDTPEVLEEVDVEFAIEIPLPVKGYLLSWILVFDHFENASFKVKSTYAASLKEGQYLVPLLDFIAAFLFSSDRRAFDASKVDIKTYTPDTTENAVQELRWLQTHVYYLALRHTPSLVKAWWLELSNRAIVKAAERFTEKYVSPLLVDNELSAVAEWAQNRDEAEEDGMKVKVGKAVREVTASYPVDDQAMDILVRLPAMFPLRKVEVTGLRRVGLDEKKFSQMQLASQAVVNFQSGSIIDALTLFRKNVSFHFQGVSECAICYSILAITPDRSLPKRACATCKNKFHSTCLLKWFKTSNSSSCPLCRTSFSFYS